MKTRLILSVIFLIVLSITSVKSQIVYTNLPDTNINFPIIEFLGSATTTYYIDINNDGTDDFFFWLRKWQEWFSPNSQPIYYACELRVLGANSIYSDEPCAKVLNGNDIIDLNSNWNQEGYIYIRVITYYSECSIPFQDKYYGLNFNIGSNTHYGWLNLDISENGEIVLKGYAYNTIPDELILAGQKELDNVYIESQKSPLIIYNTKKEVIIKQKATNELIKLVKIYNLSGTIIHECHVNAFQATINTSDINHGICVIRVVMDKNIYSRLLYIN